MKIGARAIGAGERCYVIAELSCNHRGSLDQARQLVDAAARAGADAIKLQTFAPGGMTVHHWHPAYILRSGPWQGRHLYDLYAEAQTPWEWHAELFAHAHALGMGAFSTPGHPGAVDFLEALDVPAYKVASFEATDVLLLRRLAQTGKPVILSTGMCSDRDIDHSLGILAGQCPVALLHCVSAYPTPAAFANLRRMDHLRERFGLPVGLSDHGQGPEAALAAVARGCPILERHLGPADGDTLDGPFSSTPDGFAHLVASIRAVEDTLAYSGGIVEQPSLAVRRRLVWARELPAGHVVEDGDVRTARCGDGLSPWLFDALTGLRLKHAVTVGDPIHWGDVGG